jgi:CRP-like cAMP-binding protein
VPRAKTRVELREKRTAFDAEAFLSSAGATRRLATYRKGKIVFSQGQPSDAVMYIQKGGIKISVLSRNGKEAVVAMLGPSDFFGEGSLTGQPIRIGTATATMPTTVVVIEKGAMLRLLRDEPTFSERFISYMLERNLRVEADLVDHLFNSSEKRLARTLSCRTTLRSEVLTLRSPLYSMNPRSLNLFMKKLTRERVVPTISARVSWEIFAAGAVRR